jgi:predicted nuclease with RNAse H fold
MLHRVVGIDCATEDAKIGIALGWVSDGVLEINRGHLCNKEQSAARTIAGWIKERAEPTLIAVDAPLGWPTALSRDLQAHRAGAALPTEANDLFRRETDRFIKRELGKTPLDVGADRIARTAHAALRLLSELSAELGAPVPLVWEHTVMETAGVIEVYPAATLSSHGIRASGYKRPNQIEERREILRALADVAQLPSDLSPFESSADTLDAAVCLVAALDFLLGHAVPPADQQLAEREGWIWVRPRSSRTSRKARKV